MAVSWVSCSECLTVEHLGNLLVANLETSLAENLAVQTVEKMVGNLVLPKALGLVWMSVASKVTMSVDWTESKLAGTMAVLLGYL